MIRLIGLELTRLRWRRAVVVLLAGCTLVTLVIFAGTAWSTRPISDSDLQQAQEQVDRELAQPYMQRQIRQCEKRPGRYGVGDPEQCAERMGPQVEWYVGRDELRAGRAFREAGLGVMTIVMGLLMLVGTTFAGADWNSGSMSNQLLFEPRRARVWLAKAVAVFAVSVATSAVLLAGFAGGLLLLARSRGLEVPPEVPGWMVSSSGRAVLLIGAAAVGAYAVTMLVRSTVFTLGAMFAVVVGATLGDGADRNQRGVVPQQEPERGDLERRDVLRPAARRLLHGGSGASRARLQRSGAARPVGGRPQPRRPPAGGRGCLPVVLPAT